MRNPESQAWRERIPEQDTAPPEDGLPLPDPAEWGVTPDEARAMLERQMCPVCGEGPWKSPLNHVSRKHAINRHVMRDVCLLSTHEKVTDEESRARWSSNGRAQVETLTANSDRARGTSGRKMRMTAAFRATLGQNLQRWMDENPNEIAAMRADFRSRMESPAALEKWRTSMERVWAEQGEKWTDEERAAFRERMSAPDVVAKREAARAEGTTLVCTLDGCEQPHLARGYCITHWNRWNRNGDPGPARKFTPAEGARMGRPKKRALSEAQMAEVRDAYAAGGVTQGHLAERFGVTQSIISRVVRGEYAD